MRTVALILARAVLAVLAAPVWLVLQVAKLAGVLTAWLGLAILLGLLAAPAPGAALPMMVIGFSIIAAVEVLRSGWNALRSMTAT